MIRKYVNIIIAVILFSFQVIGAGTRIRINQLGYLPKAAKQAVLISESDIKVKDFTIHDALTDEVCGQFNTVSFWGRFDKFNSNYTLDFSEFEQTGAFYIKTGDTYSPTFFINKHHFVHTTDQLLAYLRSQRIGNKVSGAWWYDASNKNRNASVNASVTYQLLFAYSNYPDVFMDMYNQQGEKEPNGIPDILDEAKWGLDWLSNIQYTSMSDGTNGKLVAALALAAQVYKNLDVAFADQLANKATQIYQYAQSEEVTEKNHEPTEDFQEENRKDDMQSAATQLYLLTYNKFYLRDAVAFGASEPVPAWLFTSCDPALRFYPYVNWSPYLLLQIENPQIKRDYLHNIMVSLQRARLTAQGNPFNIGVNFSENSNNKIIALHNMCVTYRQLTHDLQFMDLEESLYNWIFGCNPWGISMITGIPDTGTTPFHPHIKSYIETDHIPVGAVVSGAVNSTCLKDSEIDQLSFDGFYERYQTEWAVYHDHVNDDITNQPNIDASAGLLHLLAARQSFVEQDYLFDYNHYDAGGITRFNPEQKQILITFTAHQYDDGFKKIVSTLKKHNIKAAFFFSGDFLRKPKAKKQIKKLKSQGHYVGPAGNHYLQLTDWNKAEGLYLNKAAFFSDLKENYAALSKHGISKQQAPFFNPPFELYNDSISQWCKEAGIYIVRSTPGTDSNLDYTFPEMRERYYSSKDILNKIMQVEDKSGLNGYILQFNYGTNPARKDKLYKHLGNLWMDLKKEGYEFVDIFEAVKLF